MDRDIPSQAKQYKSFPIYPLVLIKGLNVLHNMNILHRDLKSANVFLSKNKLIAKIGDLNVSQVT